MSVMIVGADHLGSIEKSLHEHGFTDIEHIRGRNTADRKKFNIPQATRLIVVLTDYINHSTARNVKEKAKERGVPMVFAKRSWCSLYEQLKKCGVTKTEKPANKQDSLCRS
ncbi:MAG: DUF2325 domain-containing protein [Negativicutes bacterium]|nr:DUF2325 domain-containing protein [Negativicutes bacterium]